ncbi:MAG: hydrogenase maturation nickel metallochaperone HypA [Caldilineaceae bacterium]
MHEFGIMSQLVEAVEQKAQELQARRILVVNLLIGDRMGLVENSLQFYFDMLTAGSVLEGAVLHLRYVKTHFYCTPCAATYAPVGANFQCPTCGAVGEITLTGSEFLVESLEIEVDDKGK